MLTEDDVRAVVDSLLTTRTQKQLAEELGVSTGYLNDYLHFRREPGAKLLEGLGIRRVAMYENLEPNAVAWIELLAVQTEIEMEPDTIQMHCSNCEPSKWVQLPREKVVVMLDLKRDEWVFEATCHLCGKDILNTRGMYRQQWDARSDER